MRGDPGQVLHDRLMGESVLFERERGSAVQW